MSGWSHVWGLPLPGSTIWRVFIDACRSWTSDLTFENNLDEWSQDLLVAAARGCFQWHSKEGTVLCPILRNRAMHHEKEDEEEGEGNPAPYVKEESEA